MDGEKLTGQLKTLNVWTLRNFKRISKTLISIYCLHLERKTATTTLRLSPILQDIKESFVLENRTEHLQCMSSLKDSEPWLSYPSLTFFKNVGIHFFKAILGWFLWYTTEKWKKNSECIFLEICKNSRNSLKKLYFSMHWRVSDMMFTAIKRTELIFLLK